MSLIFGIASFLFISPNDNYRIYEYLKEKKSPFVETETILKHFKKKNEPLAIDEDAFDEKVDESCCEKFTNKIFFIFTYCCKNERTLHRYIINEYLDDKLSIENQLK